MTITEAMPEFDRDQFEAAMSRAAELHSQGLYGEAFNARRPIVFTAPDGSIEKSRGLLADSEDLELLGLFGNALVFAKIALANEEARIILDKGDISSDDVNVELDTTMAYVQKYTGEVALHGIEYHPRNVSDVA